MASVSSKSKSLEQIFLLLFCIVFCAAGCAEAQSPEKWGSETTDDRDTGRSDLDSDSTHAISTDDTETNSSPVEDTDWMDDPNIIYYWSFNGNDGDFTPSLIEGAANPWEWGIPNAEETIYYPSKADGRVWGTNLNGVHGVCETAALTSKEFDLSSYGGKTLTISWIHSIYYYYDPNAGDSSENIYQTGFTIEVFNGSEWVAPEPPSCDGDNCECDSGWTAPAFTMSCDGVPLYLDEKPGFGSNSCAWEKRQITMSWPSYPATFKFRFVHGAADMSVEELKDRFKKPGAYIDNVALRIN